MAKGNFFSFLFGAAIGAGLVYIAKSENRDQILESAKNAGKRLMEKLDALEEKCALDLEDEADV